MIYETTISGLTLRTGDIVCTTDGVPFGLAGRIWEFLGMLVPGEVDHCVLYVGPGRRFIEAGALGVISFEKPGNTWDAVPLGQERQLLDQLIGAAYPLADLNLSPREEHTIRKGIARWAKQQLGKPYNPNFLDVQTDDAFYCSQLIYRAYLEQGIDLLAHRRTDSSNPLRQIVFPQQIWQSNVTRRPSLAPNSTQEPTPHPTH